MNAYLGFMWQDLMAHTDQVNQATRKDLIKETRVLIEDVRHDLHGVADGVLTVNQKLDRAIADQEERITRLERRVP